MLSRYSLLFINGAILTVCAVFDYAWRTHLLVGMMLFLPFLDRAWQMSGLKIRGFRVTVWLLLLLTGLMITGFNPDYSTAALYALCFAALPEEWFFRGYFMGRVEQFISRQGDNSWLNPAIKANILTSLFFTLLHLPIQGSSGLLVFIPSLFYGWLYQKYRDIMLVILLHALSNIIFVIYLREYL